MLHIKSHELNWNIREPLASGSLTSSLLLQDEIYVSNLRAEIPNFKQKYVDVEDLRLKWDLIEMEIRRFTIKYSKNKAKERKSAEINLQNQINELYKKAETLPINKQIINEIYDARLPLK